MMKKLVIPAVAAALLLASCSRPEYKSFNGVVWNTTFSITYQSDKNLEDSVRMVMREVELSLSPFNNSSIVTAVNNGEDVKVDPMFAEVFHISQKINTLSGGAFEPTIAPLVCLWGFGFDDIQPSEGEVERLMSGVGISECEIVDGKVVKKTPDTKFDFSAVAKGYGCDAIAGMLTRNGCDNHLIEIGGEIVAKGVNERGKKWRVMIDAPVFSMDEVRHEPLEILDLTDCGVATSGNYRNFNRNAEGEIVGHIISPFTGYPVRTYTLSATVIAPDCATADALATACMVMSADEAMDMINSLNDTYLLLVKSEPKSDDGWNVLKSKGFPE